MQIQSSQEESSSDRFQVGSNVLIHSSVGHAVKGKVLGVPEECLGCGCDAYPCETESGNQLVVCSSVLSRPN